MQSPSVLERQRASLNWLQRESMWYSYGTNHYPIAEEDSVGIVLEDTLREDNGMKKRKAIAKVDSSDRKKQQQLDPDEIQVMEVPKLELNNNKEKEVLGESTCYQSKAASEPAAQKTDYIHVRARRGQATDSHSLAERVRREKISERMKYLQDLVPGCNSITGKASVLDEIINYVQSLQNQVEFLSRKLAAVDPLIDCNTQSFMGEEINSSQSTSISREMSSELLKPSYPLFNPLDPAAIPSHCGLGITMNLLELGALHKTIRAPVSVSDAFSEPYFDVCGSSAWDYNMQELYKMDCAKGKESSFPSHLPQGGDNDMQWGLLHHDKIAG